MTLASALGCGLLIGLERERSKQRENQQSFAGLRSFAICALLGAICFLFGVSIGIVGALIIGGIVIFSMKNQTEDLGSTTELAFVMTY
ncbi:MgtC/SapB family protein, partial [bacterium LRH843]|nr:MgtC/SapB family protein [bacterium LRH843]